jgi:hypothetical protein
VIPFTDFFAHIQSLMRDHAGLFMAMSNDMAKAFVGWHIFLFGWNIWRDRASWGDALMLTIKLSIGLTMCVFYSAPIPGFGFSTYGFFTDSGNELSRVVNEIGTEQLLVALDKTYDSMQDPGWSLLRYDAKALFNFIVIRVVLLLLSAAVFAVGCWGFIAACIGILLGPIFVAFYLSPVDHFEKFFWQWVTFMFEYAILWGVTLNLYLFIAGQVLIKTLEAIEPNLNMIGQAKYALPAAMVAGSFLYGLLQVTKVPHHLLHGGGGSSGWGIGRLRIG